MLEVCFVALKMSILNTMNMQDSRISVLEEEISGMLDKQIKLGGKYFYVLALGRLIVKHQQQE